MKVISPKRLVKTDFNILNSFSMFQYWKAGSYFTSVNDPRPTHGLICLYGTDIEYILKDGTVFTAKQGDIVYLPEGSEYTTNFKNVSDNGPATILINFSLYDQNNEPFTLFSKVSIIPVNNSEYFKAAFKKAAEIAGEVNFSFPKLKSHLYEIFYHLGTNAYISDMPSPLFGIIEKGIAYLENDGDQLLSIDDIAKMCNVSSTYFRKLFYMYSGKNPLEFRINIKIERAKHLLDTHLFTVSEVSDALGFNDTAYFSRLFKKRTGISPCSYLKKKV